MDKLVKRGFILLLILLPSLLYLAYHIPQNIVYNPENEVVTTPLTPLTQELIEDYTYRFTFDVADRPYACDALYVQSKHSEVTVYADGELLYSLKRGEKPWMNSTGTVYDFVYLSPEVKTLEAIVHNLYADVSSGRAIFSVGNSSKIFNTLTKNAYIPTIISITEIFIGLLMLVFWYFFVRQGQVRYALAYLALFSIAVGAWSLSASANFVLIVKNQAAASSTSFIALMFFVLPFLQFTKHYYGYAKRVAEILSISAIITGLLVVALHFADIAGFKQTVVLIHIHIALAAIYYAYNFVRFITAAKNLERKLMTIIATAILLGSAVFDFALYFQGNMQSNFAGRIGFMIYFLILGYDTLNTMVLELQESRKSAIYKELAYNDNLTKLYNRNAFNERELSNENPWPVTVINLDLNDLKKCNDSCGHVSGDKYIADSAALIYDVFNNYGKCYRTGGDEFAIVVNPACSKKQIDDLLEELEQKQADYNRTSTVVQMHMAYGYAKFDPALDKNLEATCIRADARMYAHKRELKKITGGEIR